MIKIVKLTRTCDACPAQWSGRDSEDHPIYIRYRYGRLKVERGPRGGDDDSAVFGEEIFSKDVGDGFDGFMEFDELKKHTENVLEFALEEKDIGKDTSIYIVNPNDGTSLKIQNIEDLPKALKNLDNKESE